MQLQPGWQTAVFVNVLFWIIFTSITFGLRIYVRLFKLRRLRSDDWLMIACQPVFLVYAITQALSCVNGIGVRDQLLTRDDIVTARFYWYISACAYPPATVLVKLSAGAFILNVTNNKYHGWIIYFLAAMSIAFGTFYTFVLALQCRPISIIWLTQTSDQSATCLDATFSLAASYVVSVLNAIGDLCYTILPFHLLRHSTLRRRTKIGVCLLLSLGSLAGLATLVRTFFLAPTLSHLYGAASGDFLWYGAPLAVLSSIELGLGISMACVATLRPLFQRTDAARQRQRELDFESGFFQSGKGFFSALSGGLATDRTKSRNRTGFDKSELYVAGTREVEIGDLPDMVVLGQEAKEVSEKAETKGT